jgi:hypothetical protein
MNAFSNLKAAVCVTALMSASTAIADVTAGDVWADWQENLAVYGDDGIEIGSEEMSGDTLTISDIVLSMEDEYSTVESEFGSLNFTENGDGTVTVTMPESYPINMNFEGSEVALTVFNTGMSLVVSGEPQNLSYELSADTYGIRVDSIEDVEGDMRITANKLAGTYGVEDMGEMRDVSYEIGAASIDVLVDASEPDGDGYVVFSGKINDFASIFAANMPADLDYDKPEEMFVGGFGFEGGYSFGAASYLFDFNADGDQAAGTATMTSGGMDATFNAAQLAYSAGAKDVAIQMQAPDLPFPVQISAAEYGVEVFMPLSKTEEPAKFGTSINLTDFVFNEDIWAMVDPTNALPHDPATLQLDLTGTTKLYFDVLDPEQADAMQDADVPGELISLSLENLTVAAAGALVKGAGAFTFDNDDLETFDGIPRPTGEINVEITGANALIDSLVSMGLLPEDQAMMGRMMMGMFARTVGDDQLTSKLEINAEGHVLANGQRIQ